MTHKKDEKVRPFLYRDFAFRKQKSGLVNTATDCEDGGERIREGRCCRRREEEEEDEHDPR